MKQQIVSGIFEDISHAEDAQSYLLANEFTEEHVVIADGSTLIVTAASAIEAQEAADVLRNYGATNIALRSS